SLACCTSSGMGSPLEIPATPGGHSPRKNCGRIPAAATGNSRGRPTLLAAELADEPVALLQGSAGRVTPEATSVSRHPHPPKRGRPARRLGPWLRSGPRSARARLAPDRFERAALRWHGRWTTESSPASIAEAQLALTCLQLLTADHRSRALSVLRDLAER